MVTVCRLQQPDDEDNSVYGIRTKKVVWLMWSGLMCQLSFVQLSKESFSHVLNSKTCLVKPPTNNFHVTVLTSRPSTQGGLSDGYSIPLLVYGLFSYSSILGLAIDLCPLHSEVKKISVLNHKVYNLEIRIHCSQFTLLEFDETFEI